MAQGGLKKALHFLGLVEDYEDEYADVHPPEAQQPGMLAEPPAAPRVEPSNVRRIPPAGEEMPSASSSPYGPAATPAPVAPTGTVNVLGGPSTRPEAPSGGPQLAEKVHITSPSTFNDVEEVGENFRDGTPVLMNLQAASEAVAKRLLDFASGLIYGLDGRIERVADRVFLLTPDEVTVSDDEMDRLKERGLVG